MTTNKTEILSYKTVQYWLEGLGKITKRNYLRYFPAWLKHTKETLGTDDPDKLIELRMEDLKSDNRRQRKRFEHMAKVWYHGIYDQFEKEGKSTGHANNFLKAVQSFFSRNDVPLKFRRGEIRPVKKKIKRIFIEIEDLKTAYTVLTVRDRAIFATLLQSGLSEIDVCALNIQDVLKELDNPPIYIEGYREKTTVRFQTCIGEDAAIAIKKYLILRGNPKTGALFTTKFNKRATSRSIREALQPVKKVVKNFKAKMLRDVFHDSLERANVKESTATRMFGHQLKGAKADYLFSPETIKLGYQKTYPLLTIDHGTRATSADRSTKQLVLKLGELLSIIATEGQEAGIWGITRLITELKGQEVKPETKRLFETRLSRGLTEEEKTDIQTQFNDALRTYLLSI